MLSSFIQITYLISAVLFILSLKGLSTLKYARAASIQGIVGMMLALGVTFYFPHLIYKTPLIIVIVVAGFIGGYIAYKVPMTAMPQLVAGFHSFVGLAAVLVAYAAMLSPESLGIGIKGNIHVSALIEMSLGAVIGALTFSGSVIAFLKLHGLIKSGAVQFFGQRYLCLFITALLAVLMLYFVSTESVILFNWLVILSFILGILLIIPIGGADMPVVISMLNSYSGFAAAGIGFTITNHLLIITGALVGSSGAILSYIMCKAMNRSLTKIVLVAFASAELPRDDINHDEKTVKASNAEDAAFLLQNARSVIIVPGYGMAVAHSQHAIKEMMDILEKNDVAVRFAIHPVAGRMPGHMNVLLAEANVDYDTVFELEDINHDFSQTDIALVIGANDITNPAAKTNPSSPIYGMPILDVENAKTVLFIKRSMATGYSGIDNELFYRDNTLMLFGDAKKVIDDIVKLLKEH